MLLADAMSSPHDGSPTTAMNAGVLHLLARTTLHLPVAGGILSVRLDYSRFGIDAKGRRGLGGTE